MHVDCKKFLVAAAVILTLLVPIWSSFEKPADEMDEGALLVYPELILKGQVPYRDFELPSLSTEKPGRSGKLI
jgi:hypothetical protein